LVAEIFPKHARTHAGGIFHATGVLGTWMATLTAMEVGDEWRIAYLVGVLPALLTLWVRASVHEPVSWQEARDSGRRMGSFADLFGDRRWRKRALLGMALAAVGLGTFWGVCVATQDLVRELLLRLNMPAAQAENKARFAYGIIQVLGAGVGQLSFGPLCARFGRKRSFVAMHVLSFFMVLAVAYLPQTYWHMLILLPIFGFVTLSIHAGYAIYFPELFPNHLRATGASFCFNAGRILAAPMLIFSGYVKTWTTLPNAMAMLGGLFLVGLVVLAFLPETKGEDLPEE